MTLPAPQPQTLLYLGHLSWDHVWQRPQQLMSRLAASYRVLYIDPPEVTSAVTELKLSRRTGTVGLEVLRPLFPERRLHPGGQTYEDLWRAILPQVLALAGPRPILWVSSPHAYYLVEAARSQVALVVYDCMDDLASFRDGTSAMRRYEEALLGHADLLFTGGYSMYEARKNRHHRAYCFPSGVDVVHYQQTRDPALPEPASVEAVPHPRLGYFGVLDERIDWPLIAAVSARRPDWHWLLVGPTVKVAPEELPRATNIHYLGQQAYADLPAYLKAFDIATMPFARNAATLFISPTKTLEYLAGGKPVISSSVPDVVAFYQGIVHLADGADAWISAVDAVLAAGSRPQPAREARLAGMLQANTWDSVVARMRQLVEAQLAAQPAAVAEPAPYHFDLAMWMSS